MCRNTWRPMQVMYKATFCNVSCYLSLTFFWVGNTPVNFKFFVIRYQITRIGSKKASRWLVWEQLLEMMIFRCLKLSWSLVRSSPHGIVWERSPRGSTAPADQYTPRTLQRAESTAFRRDARDLYFTGEGHRRRPSRPAVCSPVLSTPLYSDLLFCTSDLLVGGGATVRTHFLRNLEFNV